MRGRIARAADRLTARLAPRVPDFHGLLAAQCAVVVEALDELVAFASGGAAQHGERVRALEKEGDRREALTLDTLARAFATPIDRGAIYIAATAIDDVLNYAKTTVREIEVLGVPPDRWMAQMAAELRVGGEALRQGFVLLRDDPEAAHAQALAVHKSERTAEKTYRAAVADVLAPAHVREALGPGGARVEEAFEALMLALRRREVYRHLSNMADHLDTAARALLDIVFADV
ncbi:MAG TPA: DUF47 family protein [Miltoncostaea sp.]|nr:DUF47 family protein [Miltoncostaea sp.]